MGASAAQVTLATGGESRVATGVAVLDHLLEELARTGGFELRLEIAPGEPGAERATGACCNVTRSTGAGATA